MGPISVGGDVQGPEKQTSSLSKRLVAIADCAARLCRGCHPRPSTIHARATDSLGIMKPGYQLPARIVELSVANEWDEAHLEWHLEKVILSDTSEACLCGKFPIKELCILRNDKNKKSAVVGNCCVKKFFPIASARIFNAIKKITADDTRALNADTIHFAYQRGWLSAKERAFYMDTWRKHKLSAKQMQWRIALNRRVMERVRAA